MHDNKMVVIPFKQIEVLSSTLQLLTAVYYLQCHL